MYVGCSGNLTVERVLAQGGVTEIHGNDVSLYSCVLGTTVAGDPIPVTVSPTSPHQWLADYLAPGIPTVATLLLAMEYFKSAGRSEPYHQRLARAYETQWPRLHAQSVAKAERLLSGLRLASFTCGDVVPFLCNAPTDAVVVTFPPTYASGYERLYRALDETFVWAKPAYEVFTPERFEALTEVMRSKAAWVTMRDLDLPALAPWCIGRFQTSASNKAVYVYAGDGPIRTTHVQQRTEPLPWRRLSGRVVGPLKLVRLTIGQLNTLRSEYLAPGIVPANAQLALGILTAEEELLGALAFCHPQKLVGDHDIYLLSDFPVTPTGYRRLSKLVTAVALSTEVRAVLEQFLNRRVRRIGTHAFTSKPVSMKYRGVLTLRHRRKADGDKPAALYYNGDAGRWSLEGALAWWTRQHAPTVTAPGASA